LAAALAMEMELFAQIHYFLRLLAGLAGRPRRGLEKAFDTPRKNPKVRP